MVSQPNWRDGGACAQPTGQPAPAKAGAWIGLAAGRNVFMPDDGSKGVAPRRRTQQTRQREVLGSLKRRRLQALKLDPDRVVIAVFAACPARRPRMPSAVVTGNKLQHLTVAADEEVSRDLQASQSFEVRMFARVQAVGEQPLHLAAAVVARWQAD